MFSTRDGTTGNRLTIGLQSDNTLIVYGNNGSVDTISVFTQQVFRDPSAWYHIVIALDTTQATASNRCKVYVNGSQVTSFSTATYPTQNADLAINQASEHNIGKYALTGNFVDGYMTEINFINGQALTPSSFGETNAQTGVWQPKAYSGSYGTNGFYLNFSDNSNTTAATLGKDYSGNGNNWTPNNFSVTAGAGNDSLVDTPTPYGSDSGAGGEVRGNYCTFNPLKIDTNLSLANGNLDLTRANSSGWKNAEATVGVQSGKWYFEITPTGANLPANFMLGVGDPTQIAVDAYLGGTSRVWGYQGNGNYYNNGTTYGSKPTISANDVVMVAYDLDSGKLWFGKNGSWNGGGSPASGTSADFTNLTGTISAAAGWFAAGTAHINFGQRPFAYTAPSGFKALCTQNLPTPTIGATTATQANKYFDVVLRTSNGSAGGTYSTTVNMSNGALLWDKARSITSAHYLLDSVRGISKTLSSNTTGAEASYPSWFTNFGTSSFTTGPDDYTAGTTVVDWIWAANGSGSSNTAGSITSTVSANTTSGFSVVTYTGNGTDNATIGHGLGASPQLIIVKSRSNVTGWPVWHGTFAANDYMTLDTTAAKASASSLFGGSNASLPTSTVFKVGTNGSVNASSYTYVAYCFAPIAGYSAFGSYTGNGSTDGPFVFTGFRPALILMKTSSVSGNDWYLYDDARPTYNAAVKPLFPNGSFAEQPDDRPVDFLSNGFKIRYNQFFNANGETVIFAAFAEAPFKFALAR